MLQTPVAFFVFNRPGTTKRVFDAIAQAKPRQLFVVADGPRDSMPGEADICAEVRDIIKQVDWDCDVVTQYSENNLGCKVRISSGLDWVFSQVEEAIILEDDCLPVPDFFLFCEKMLEKYRHDEHIMLISGTNVFLDEWSRKTKDSYMFSRYFSIWGWASWRRAWKLYDINMTKWPAYKKEKSLSSFYPRKYMTRYISFLFDQSYSGKMNSWDTQLFYSFLFNEGVSVVPVVNLISNIGLSGTHTLGLKDKKRRKKKDVINRPVFSLDCTKLKHPSSNYYDGKYDAGLFRLYFRGLWLKRVVGKIRAIKGKIFK